MSFIIRPATREDMDSIEKLMKKSMRILGQGHYTKEQILSSCTHVCIPDEQVIDDGTYYLAETDDKVIIGCGGWSYRKTLFAGPKSKESKDSSLDPSTDPARIRAMFTDPNHSGKGVGSCILETSENAAKEYGFKKGVLGSTLSGLNFYKSKGWESVKKEESTLADGVKITVVHMLKEW